MSPEFSSKYYIGTSGWTYDHWKGCFYPSNLARSRWFDYYSARFNAVEVNATFYRAFSDRTYLNWKARAPQGFGYVLKAPKNITHIKMLRNAEMDIQNFCHSIELLGTTFQMILLQLPPNLSYDPGLLRSALQAFPNPTRVAVEFRHECWFNPAIEKLLASAGAVFCNVDSPSQPLTACLTSERAYVRLHGRNNWYASNYSDEELAGIADQVRQLCHNGAKQLYIFFNNDIGGYAPLNAQTLSRNLQ